MGVLKFYVWKFPHTLILKKKNYQKPPTCDVNLNKRCSGEGGWWQGGQLEHCQRRRDLRGAAGWPRPRLPHRLPGVRLDRQEGQQGQEGEEGDLCVAEVLNHFSTFRIVLGDAFIKPYSH